jgi:hypothetical protein
MAKNKRLGGKADKSASPAVVRQRSREQLYTEGKSIRDICARVSHADWKPPADRPEPIDILEASNEGRFPELIPFRYGRMIPSPFVLQGIRILFLCEEIFDHSFRRRGE